MSGRRGARRGGRNVGLVRAEGGADACADLDRSNVSNAYVSGMKEDLHMFGNEYNVCAKFVALRQTWC